MWAGWGGFDRLFFEDSNSLDRGPKAIRDHDQRRVTMKLFFWAAPVLEACGMVRMTICGRLKGARMIPKRVIVS